MKIYFSLTGDTGCMESALKKAFAAHELMICAGRTDWEGGSKPEEANGWGADLYIVLRTGKTGLKLLAAGKEGSKSWTACESVLSALKPIVSDGAGCVENGDQYAEISQTRMTSVYIILPNDADWVSRNTEEIAYAVFSGVSYWELKAGEKSVVSENSGEMDENSETSDSIGSVSDAELGRALRTLLREFWREI